MSGGFLDRMAESSRLRSEQAKRRLSPEALGKRVAALPAPHRPAFSREGFDLIAEIKPGSPSEGSLADAEFSADALAHEYVAAGAMALSVLTEPRYFDGSLELLAGLAGVLPGTPIMRKDFLVEPYQVLEARLYGASGVLLILGMTAEENTRAMLETALGLGMFALIEAFEESGLEQAQELAARLGAPPESVLLGLNCRDLQTLAVDTGRFFRVDLHRRGSYRVFAESGMEEPGQARELAAHGWDGLLMGTALMRADDPRALAAAMLAEGRGSRSAS